MWGKTLDLVPVPLRGDPDLAQRRGLARTGDALNGEYSIAIGKRLSDNALLRRIQTL
jgi:hypothetical protein